MTGNQNQGPSETSVPLSVAFGIVGPGRGQSHTKLNMARVAIQSDFEKSDYAKLKPTVQGDVKESGVGDTSMYVRVTHLPDSSKSPTEIGMGLGEIVRKAVKKEFNLEMVGVEVEIGPLPYRFRAYHSEPKGRIDAVFPI